MDFRSSGEDVQMLRQLVLEKYEEMRASGAGR